MSEATFQQLYQANLDYVWSSLRRLGVAPAHRDDCTHDVFLAAWRKLSDYDPTRPVKPWLFGICFRVASDFRQRAWVRREVSGLGPNRQSDTLGADHCVEADERKKLVRKALGAIALERRAVFIMHELDEAPIPEVAAALGIPLNTAYSRLRLARRDFEAEVRRLSQPPVQSTASRSMLAALHLAGEAFRGSREFLGPLSPAGRDFAH